VAAGFAPIGIGTETDGSVVYPATRAGLYAIKPSLGAIPLEGAMPVNPAFDTHGAMAKSTQDLADIFEVIMGGEDFSGRSGRTWKSFSLGFVDPKLWQLLPDEMELIEEFNNQAASTTTQDLFHLSSNSY
jgi:amidase